MDKELLVVIPAYNEEENIGGFLDTLHEKGIFEMADVLVVNDGSADNTSAIARKKGSDVVTHLYNLGYGCALQTGYKYAVRYGYKYLVQIDGDGQHDASSVTRVCGELMKPNGPDIVIGSRFLKESVTFRVRFVKRMAIWFFRGIIKISTGRSILDPTSGLQGLNRKAFLYYSYYNNFVHDYPDANMIIQMLLNNFKIKEVPVIMHARSAGKSMHSGLAPAMYILKMVLNTLVVIARERKRFKKSKNPG